MANIENSMNDLKKFLSTPDRAVLSKEFVEFWKTLTSAEKAEFKSTKLG